jgi:uncharacterized protein (DUF3084 family)
VGRLSLLQVKASLAAPMNTNQMKAAMEDLATKARDLEDREAELRASRSLADQREKQLTSKNREVRSLALSLSHCFLTPSTDGEVRSLALSLSLTFLTPRALMRGAVQTVALEGDLSQSRIELATVKRELDKMRQKVRPNLGLR